MLTGITNPRSIQPTEVVVIKTFDADGISEIDAGFDKSIEMQDLAKIDSFSVRASSEVNGEINTYTFTLTTRYRFIDGDVLKFTVPPEVKLPSTIDEFNIQGLPRTVDGEQVKDDLIVEMSG